MADDIPASYLFGGLIALYVMFKIVTSGAMWRGLALAIIIIGCLISLTGLGVIVGVPMILSGSILLCCCGCGAPPARHYD